MAAYTRCSNVICIDINGKVLKRVAVKNGRVGMRLGQLNDGLVILCVMIHSILVDLGNMEHAMQQIGCPESVQWRSGDCITEPTDGFE